MRAWAACKEGRLITRPADLHADDESRIDAMLWHSLVGQIVGLRCVQLALGGNWWYGADRPHLRMAQVFNVLCGEALRACELTRS